MGGGGGGESGGGGGESGGGGGNAACRTHNPQSMKLGSFAFQEFMHLQLQGAQKHFFKKNIQPTIHEPRAWSSSRIDIEDHNEHRNRHFHTFWINNCHGNSHISIAYCQF